MTRKKYRNRYQGPPLLSRAALGILLLVPFLALSGCREGEGSAGETLTPVTLRLQWHTQCQFAGYYAALEEGFYRDKGLDVTIKQGGYGKNPLETVALGQEEFGTKWPADILSSQKKLICLANILKENGLRLVARKETGIRGPRDLEGKTLSIWFIGNETQLFTLLEDHGISPSRDTEIIPQRWDLSQFLNREVDAFSVMNYNELLQLQEYGFSPKDLSIISYKDYGLSFPGQSLFTSREYAAAHPEICRRFTQASLKGWQFAAENPRETVDHVMAHDSDGLLSRELQSRQLSRIISLMGTDRYPLGKNIPSQYRKIADLYRKYGLLPEDFTPEEYYTNEFIP